MTSRDHDEDARRLTRRRLRETDHGRSLGWDIELEGRVVARLDEPRREDMFWVSYRITPVTPDPSLSAKLLQDTFWRGEAWTALTFRSRALGVPAANPFPATRPFTEPGRLKLRGLYVMLDERHRAPAWLARIAGWLRRAVTRE